MDIKLEFQTNKTKLRILNPIFKLDPYKTIFTSNPIYKMPVIHAQFKNPSRFHNRHLSYKHSHMVNNKQIKEIEYKKIIKFGKYVREYIEKLCELIDRWITYEKRSWYNTQI